MTWTGSALSSGWLLAPPAIDADIARQDHNISVCDNGLEWLELVVQVGQDKQLHIKAAKTGYQIRNSSRLLPSARMAATH